MIDTIRKTLLKLRRRPALLIFTATVTLLFCVLEQFNIFTKNYGTLGALFGSDFLSKMNTLAEKVELLFRNPKLLLLMFLMTLLLLASVAAILGISYSGFFHQMLCASEEKEKRIGEMRIGISRYFLRLSLYFLAAIPATILFVLLLLYTLVPAILSVKLFFTGSSSVFFPMLLICILTALVNFFAILFYTMYATFAIPSLICFKKGAFRISCRMVNAYCWYLLPRTLAFLLLNFGIRIGLLTIHYGLSSVSASIAVLLGTWFLRTLIDFLYLNFTFNTFSAMKSDMFGTDA